uniref:Uncharacterized protein n=1 Tax=Arcella intermedia TaxID=1963864 RepID=A0A6B2LLF8_9EUKA
MLLRITGDVFSENFISTIGVDINVKSFEVDGDIIKLQIWDTAGQERFRTITSSYYRGAHGVIVVYDVTNPQTFANVRNWYQDISRYAAENAHLVLVGNKCDLDQERKVSTQDGQHLAQQLNMTFFETSAKNSTNVSEVFLKLVTDLKEQIKSPQ